MGHEHTYMQELYLNPDNVSPPSPVPGFHAIPEFSDNILSGYTQKPNKDTSIPKNAVILYNANIDCSDPTTVSPPAVVPNAVTNPVPMYNQCGQLIGYIGSIVKNGQMPVSSLMML
mgnify:CR=1 FL=1